MKLHLLNRLALGLVFLASWSQAEPLLNGVASHKELGKERFIAALYTESLSTEPSSLINSSEQKRMELRVTSKRLSSRRLNSMWIEGMAINIPGNLLSKHADNMIKFTSMIKGKLVAGDIMTIDYRPTEGTLVTVNGIELGTIVSDDFFGLLLRTWVGNVPLSSEFRQQILKAGEVDTELLARFEAITPEDNRIAAVKNWSQSKPRVAATRTPETAAPELTTPQLPVAVAAPSLATAPVLNQPEPAPAPEPEQAPAEAVAMNEADLEDEILDDEEDEDLGPALTAETLLGRQLYHSKLLKWTYKYLSYPQRALKRGQEGSVRLSVVIDREGNVKDISSIEESRYSLLNREAQGAVKRAEPFPPVPEAVAGEEFSFSLPIVFKLPK